MEASMSEGTFFLAGKAAASRLADLDDLIRTGPGTLAGRYLRKVWLPVYHSCDINAGQAKPVRALGESFTLYRGETGTIHMVDRYCPHRGNQLSTGYVEGDSIRCFYHAWKFGPDGACTEQPAEHEPFCQRIRLKTYTVREYLGFVFAYLGEGEPPAFPLYPDFEKFEGLLEIDSYSRECNYFQNVENSLDHSHMQFVHLGGEQFGDIQGKAIKVEESEWGCTLTYTRHDGKLFVSQVGMPNVLHVAAYPNDPDIGWQESLFWWVPVDDVSFIQFSLHRVPVKPDAAKRIDERRQKRRSEMDLAHQRVADEILAGRLNIKDVDPVRCDMIRLQDDVAQVGQGRIVDRKLDRLGSSDVGVVMLRKLWRREMGALADGRPLKQWRRPEGLRAVVWGMEAPPLAAPGGESGAVPQLVDVRPYVEIAEQMKLHGVMVR
jgi:5,5'-dehydrodivanillate O-demethylase